jgi:hypothetical protein
VLDRECQWKHGGLMRVSELVMAREHRARVVRAYPHEHVVLFSFA